MNFDGAAMKDLRRTGDDPGRQFRKLDGPAAQTPRFGVEAPVERNNPEEKWPR